MPGSLLSIDPRAVYSEGALSLALEVPLATLLRARREGRLRYSRQGRRVLFLGQWIIDWLEHDAGQPREATNAV
jgi:hypothetical protein